MPYQQKILSVAFKATCIACFLLLACHQTSIAQSNSLKADLLKLKASADSLTKRSPAEKIYVQFDKSYYAIGDTAWFKVYLFNAPTHLLSAKSGLLYIDITSDSGKLIKQYLFAVKNGIAWGDVGFNPKEFKTGGYMLRAYTNWMRNFSTDGFYYKHFDIYDSNENTWLIKSEINASKSSKDKTPVNVRLQFTGPDKIPDTGKLMQLKVLSGSKTLYKQKIKTDQHGLLNIDFQLPDITSSPIMVAESEQKDQKAVIPLNLNRADRIDLQFLAEGGNLVAGLQANVAFKAIGEDGKGVQVVGAIMDHNHQQVANFQSLHNGMGRFSLAVKEGEVYTAQLSLPGGTVKTYPLPMVKSSGITLQLKNEMASDSVEVAIAATHDLMQQGNSCFLIGKSRGIICYAAIVNFHEGNFIRKKVAKSLFPTGIAHFIVTASMGQPLNERLVFIDHRDDLRIRITSNQPEYVSRDSVSLRMKVTDEAGNPISGNFSMVVQDGNMIKTDTLNEENILTRLLLTSDLEGYVEGPGYYFQLNPVAWWALDNLLLTQGWVGYEPILPALPFDAEKEFTVKGKVINVFNKPVKGSKLILFSKSPSFLMDTITNNEGNFVFDRFPVVDTPIFVIKAVNRRGKSFNVGININETKPPPFTPSKLPAMQPWYVNSDAAFINCVNNNMAINRQSEYTPDGKRKLREVVIKAQKTVKDSQNLNGPGNADLVIDEKELEQAGKKTFLQLFEEKINGFRVGHFRTSHIEPPETFDKIYRFESEIRGAGESDWYFIKDKPVILIIDGTDIEYVFQPFVFLDFTAYLESHSAEDIKGIEVNFSSKYNGNYKRRGKFQNAPIELSRALRDYAFVEITTRSGHGPVIDNTIGMYLYKPLAISRPKQFYKPRYAVQDTIRKPDLRSIIDWEPNINTDKDGMATISFFAADNAAVYNIMIEGTDMKGNIGYKRYKIAVNKRKESAKSK